MMCGLFNRGMAMHDQGAMVACIVQKGLTDPDKIGFRLLGQRYAGAQAGMDKDRLGKDVACRQVAQKGAVLGGNRRHCLGVNGGKRTVGRIADAIGGQGRRPANARMQPGHVRPQPRVLPGQIVQKGAEQPVVIAFQHGPVLPGGNAAAQKLDHPGAVRPPVHQITDMHDRPRPVPGLIAGYAVMGLFQQVQMAMNVADGIDVHGVPLTEAPGVLHPRTPAGYL